MARRKSIDETIRVYVTKIEEENEKLHEANRQLEHQAEIIARATAELKKLRPRAVFDRELYSILGIKLRE